MRPRNRRPENRSRVRLNEDDIELICGEPAVEGVTIVSVHGKERCPLT